MILPSFSPTIFILREKFEEMVLKIILFLFSLVVTTQVHAQYYKTLPKGVRLGVVRNVQTSNIDSEFNRNKSENPLSYEIDASATNLEGIDDERVKAILDILKQYPEAYNNLSGGSYKISANAQMNIMGYGMAYGITDIVTAYTALPMYDARVKMKYRRTKGNTFQDTAELLQGEPDDEAGTIGNIVEELPDIDGALIQSLVTNTFNYNEVGDWQGQGPGDLEFGILYNFHTAYDYGLLLTFGGVAPTGYVDDPDTLQDVGFGDGQWDAFVEFGGSYIFNSRFVTNSWLRYTHQFAADKRLRIPIDQEVNAGSETGTFNEKLGDKIMFDLDVDYIPSDWYNFNIAYVYEYIGESSYESQYGEANDYLAFNSDSSSHNIRLKAELNSVNKFTQNEFAIPAQIKFFYQTMVGGYNTPKVDRYEIEFRMFF